MGKINIAEILRNSPKGTKLYSPIFGDVYLDKIRPHLAIVVTTDKEQGDFKEEFLYDGRYGMNGECMLFPSKENRDWDTFEIAFNDGDIVSTKNGTWSGITTGGKTGVLIPTYCVLPPDNVLRAYFGEKERWAFDRLATEEEKQKLFAAIKANGYKWNAETKNLERLVEPKFKVGDIIKHKDTWLSERTIKSYTAGIGYFTTMNDWVRIDDQDEWELVPDKFDISTLKPFESRVLVRHNKDNKWCGSFFSHIDGDFHSFCNKFVTIAGKSYPMMIPYEGNEHLLNTTNDCDDYYKTWK